VQRKTERRGNGCAAHFRVVFCVFLMQDRNRYHLFAGIDPSQCCTAPCLQHPVLEGLLE
jgi:hypothetical protein